MVGFDVSPQVVAGIADGDIIGTAHQQGYVQGFRAVLQLGLLLDLGLSPTDVDSGGRVLIEEGDLDLLREFVGVAR